MSAKKRWLAGLAIFGVVSVAAAAAAAHRLSAATTVPVATSATAATPLRSVVHAEGRVVAAPGARAKIGAERGGRVVRVHVVRGERVRAGDVLLELDDREASAAADEARAAVGEARLTLREREREHRETTTLAGSGALPTHDLDQSKFARSAARARVFAAGAAARRAAALLAMQKIAAPIDGVVVSQSVEAGEVVTAGAPLFEVVDLSKLRVRAEVDEFDADRVATGADVRVHVEAREGEVRGAVLELGDEIVPRAMRPSDPARPTDVGVLPAFVSLPSGAGLRLGQRVDLEISPTLPVRLGARE